MSQRKTPFSLDEHFHLYNRGNSKQVIFNDYEDYFRFITLLFTCNGVNNYREFLVEKSSDKEPFLFDRGERLVSIGAYCLMPNHFHILVKEIQEGGISKFMQKLSTAYVMYYNKKYKRTGGLFEGKFKSSYLGTDKYLKYIFSYMHLNPVKLIQKDWKEKGIKNKKQALGFLVEYRFSSYLDYKGQERKYNLILNQEDFPKYFASKKDFDKEILEWIEYNQYQ